LRTVTLTVPGAAISAAAMAAVICELLTKVVVRAAPFHCIVAPEAKFVPFTVNVKAAPPAVALDGEIDVMVGTAGGGGLDVLSIQAESMALQPRTTTASNRFLVFPVIGVSSPLAVSQFRPGASCARPVASARICLRTRPPGAHCSHSLTSCQVFGGGKSLEVY
jgi:hypothetical protein